MRHETIEKNMNLMMILIVVASVSAVWSRYSR